MDGPKSLSVPVSVCDLARSLHASPACLSVCLSPLLMLYIQYVTHPVYARQPWPFFSPLSRFRLLTSPISAIDLPMDGPSFALLCLRDGTHIAHHHTPPDSLHTPSPSCLDTGNHWVCGHGCEATRTRFFRQCGVGCGTMLFLVTRTREGCYVAVCQSASHMLLRLFQQPTRGACI